MITLTCGDQTVYAYKAHGTAMSAAQRCEVAATPIVYLCASPLILSHGSSSGCHKLVYSQATTASRPCPYSHHRRLMRLRVFFNLQHGVALMILPID